MCGIIAAALNDDIDCTAEILTARGDAGIAITFEPKPNRVEISPLDTALGLGMILGAKQVRESNGIAQLGRMSVMPGLQQLPSKYCGSSGRNGIKPIGNSGGLHGL